MRPMILRIPSGLCAWPSADPMVGGPRITALVPKSGPEYEAFVARCKLIIQKMNVEHFPVQDGDTGVFRCGQNAGMLRREKYPWIAGHLLVTVHGILRPVGPVEAITAKVTVRNGIASIDAK